MTGVSVVCGVRMERKFVETVSKSGIAAVDSGSSTSMCTDPIISSQWDIETQKRSEEIALEAVTCVENFKAYFDSALTVAVATVTYYGGGYLPGGGGIPKLIEWHPIAETNNHTITGR
eukprot:GHVN01057547.1.p2 GENE.GHVN01057547.1~~GHVN01057547.1.p2  ORF type:complete len:118 (+),score=18.79 GHVN01057547.1:1337-1690(+)